MDPSSDSPLTLTKVVRVSAAAYNLAREVADANELTLLEIVSDAVLNAYTAPAD